MSQISSQENLINDNKQILDDSKIIKQVELPESLSNQTDSSQDYNQKRDALITLCLEIYRVLMGAGLMLFIPQKCGDTSCSLGDNLNRSDDYSVACLSFNLITMISFLGLYGIEFTRETKLISYLEVNKNKPMDNDSIEEELKNLDISYKNILWDLDYYYKISGYISLVAFILNGLLSGISVYSRYLDQTTVSVFVTNVLFMSLKIYEVITIVYTDKNVFYSAFLTERVQYNDVDPDKINKIKNKASGWMFDSAPPPPVPRSTELGNEESSGKKNSEDSVDSNATTVVSRLPEKTPSMEELGYIV